MPSVNLNDLLDLWPWWSLLPVAVGLAWFAMRHQKSLKLDQRLADQAGYAALLDSISEGVLVYSDGGRLAKANTKAAAVLGDHPLAREANSLFGPDHRVEDEAGREMGGANHPVARALRQELEQDRQTLKVMAPDGQTRWIRTAVTTVKLEGAPRQVVARLRDVTEQRRLEQALLEAEATFHSLFMDSPSAVSITRAADGTVLEVNPAWCRLFDWPREDAVGHTLMDLGIWLRPEDRSNFLRGFEPDREARALPFTSTRRDGLDLHLSLSMAPLTLKGEACLLAVIQDHTQVREAERAQHRIDKAESLGLMAAGISHDFNNLFQALLTSLELAQEQAEGPNRWLLDRALTSLAKASTLSQRLMEFSGGSFTRLEPLPLAKLIQDVAEQCRPGGGLDVEVHLASDLSEVLADRAQLFRIIGFLVENATEAMTEQGGTVRLASETLDQVTEVERRRGRWVVPPPEGPVVKLCVGDTGGGADPEVLDHMFEPFFSTKALGRGLGLPAVLGMVRGNRGGLQVLNQPGQGMSVQIYLAKGQSAN